MNVTLNFIIQVNTLKTLIRFLKKIICIFCFSAYNVTVPAKGRVLCMTDIQVRVPHGCYGRIAPRSGLALKNGIDVGGILI